MEIKELGTSSLKIDKLLNLNLFDIYFDLNDKKFKPQTDIKDSQDSIPIRVVFNNTEFHKICRNLDDTKFQLATHLQSIFQNYEVPIITIKGRAKDEVGIIFERINNTGTQLTPLDLMIAWTWKDDYNLKEEINDILEALSIKGFGEVKDKIILQCLCSIIKHTTVTKEILSLTPEDVRANTQKLKDSLELSIDFITSQFNIMSDDFLPNSHQIVGLTYLFSKVNHIDGNQSSCIKKWFWRTSFSNRYAGSTDQKMDEDLFFMDDVIAGNVTSINKFKSTINDEFVRKEIITKNSPFVRAIILALTQLKPLDLTNGTIIDINTSISRYNRKEYHHVFPKAYLKTCDFRNDQINIIANFCFLPSSSNKRISSKPPSDYFNNIVPQDRLDDILSSNLLPSEMAIYNSNNYSQFIETRAELIISKIRELTGE